LAPCLNPSVQVSKATQFRHPLLDFVYQKGSSERVPVNGYLEGGLFDLQHVLFRCIEIALGIS
jgi:hypothetical protein